MKDAERCELVRVLELDYEKTTKVIEGVVSSSFTIRGWGIALISALIGLTFQTQLWELAGLGIVVTLLIAFIDSYHSWLYAKLLRHATDVEHVLGLYYAALARGEDDPDAIRDFEVAALAHRFGRFAELQRFRLRALLDVRPRLIILILYVTLMICTIASGALVLFRQRSPAMKFECTAVPDARNIYVCQPK
jgi:hypothetical protein